MVSLLGRVDGEVDDSNYTCNPPCHGSSAMATYHCSVPLMVFEPDWSGGCIA
ncbi:MAG TPA: hypothetical protein VEI96_03485 [Thermodesulfovibrionales bacterium]|nr:hypothetical protein [Thermodesulfovibrionales bacterium]